MFIGKAERILAKPECISPETERQLARATRSLGNRPASGNNSLRYSAIASVSHTLTAPVVSEGTRNEGDSNSSSARVDGSSAGTICTSKSSPDILQSSQPQRP